MEDITVAVIGGSGFLGQHIIRELQEWNVKQKEWRKRTSQINSANQSNSEASAETDKPSHVSLDMPAEQSTSDDVEPDDKNVLDEDAEEDFENCSINIKEIKVLDIEPFEPFLDFAEYPPISMSFCDIRSESQVSRELDGVAVVFHCAALMLPTNQAKTMRKKETEDMFWETNLDGTENVVWACRKSNVRILIYTSTVASVMGGKKLVSHTETLTPSVDESKLMLGTYARSRKRAEDVVLDAHKVPTDNDGSLLTAVLRPVALYGEGDTRFIPAFIEMAKKAGGRLPPLGAPFAYHQLTYAGNAAVAHICAMTQLLKGSAHPMRDCGGLPTYVCDDTPTGTSDQVLSPFLNNFGLITTTPQFPLFIVLAFTMLIGLWITFWERIGYPCRWQAAIPSRQLQSLAGTTTIVSRTRAELTLRFKSKYSWEESRQASLAFYEKFIEQKTIQSLQY